MEIALKMLCSYYLMFCQGRIGEFLSITISPNFIRFLFTNVEANHHIYSKMWKTCVIRIQLLFFQLRESLYRLSELGALFLARCEWLEREKTMENVKDVPKETVIFFFLQWMKITLLQAQFVLDDKFEALLEDFLFYHERNKRIFKI